MNNSTTNMDQILQQKQKNVANTMNKRVRIFPEACFDGWPNPNKPPYEKSKTWIAVKDGHLVVTAMAGTVNLQALGKHHEMNRVNMRVSMFRSIMSYSPGLPNSLLLS